MPIARNKVLRLARLLNDDKRRGSTARLSDLTGASLVTVRGWQAEEEADHHRTMGATAQRLLAALAYMYAEGTLDDSAISKIKKIEKHMEAGKGRLDEFLERLTGRKVKSDADED